MKKRTVLVIDDAKSILSILKMTFATEFNVITKENGEEALEWLQNGNYPDAIISDIKMPVMDGMEFLTQIRSSGFFSNIPVIFLSSEDSTAERIKCLKAGVDDYVIKPFNPEELLFRTLNLVKRNESILE